MAEAVKQEDILRKAWIKKALELQKMALIRARQKEMVGSEIYALRTKEIQMVERFIEEV